MGGTIDGRLSVVGAHSSLRVCTLFTGGDVPIVEIGLGVDWSLISVLDMALWGKGGTRVAWKGKGGSTFFFFVFRIRVRGKERANRRW